MSDLEQEVVEMDENRKNEIAHDSEQDEEERFNNFMLGAEDLPPERE